LRAECWVFANASGCGHAGAQINSGYIDYRIEAIGKLSCLYLGNLLVVAANTATTATGKQRKLVSS
jgi:hypothetical protein